MLHVLTTLFVNFTTLFRPCQHPAGPRTRNKQIVNCANPALSQFPTGTTWINVPWDPSSLSLFTLSIPFSTLSISLSSTFSIFLFSLSCLSCLSISLSSALSSLTISSQSHVDSAGAPLHCPTSQPPHWKRTNQQSVCLFCTPCLPILTPTCWVLLQIRANAIKTFCSFSCSPEIANCKQRQIDILKKVLGFIVQGVISLRALFLKIQITMNDDPESFPPRAFLFL